MRIKFLIKSYCPEWIVSILKFFYLRITAMIKEFQNKPVSVQFGFDRGTPIDRFYIKEFLGK